MEHRATDTDGADQQGKQHRILPFRMSRYVATIRGSHYEEEICERVEWLGKHAGADTLTIKVDHAGRSMINLSRNAALAHRFTILHPPATLRLDFGGHRRRWASLNNVRRG